MPTFFSSPSRFQLEGLSSQGEFLASSASQLGGNTWNGELRVFSDRCKTLGAVALEYGSCCNVLFKFPSQFVACGDDSGTVRLFHVSHETGLLPLKTVFPIHNHVVSCLAVSNDLLVSGSWDKTLQVMDLNQTTTRLLATVHDHVTATCFLNESVLVVGQRSGWVQFHDLRSNRVEFQEKRASPVCSLVPFGPNSVLVGFGDGAVKEVSPPFSIAPELVKAQGAVHALAFCAETRNILIGTDAHEVRGIGFSTGNSTKHKEFVRGAAFWNNIPITASWDGTLCIHDEHL